MTALVFVYIKEEVFQAHVQNAPREWLTCQKVVWELGLILPLQFHIQVLIYDTKC